MAVIFDVVFSEDGSSVSSVGADVSNSIVGNGSKSVDLSSFNSGLLSSVDFRSSFEKNSSIDPQSNKYSVDNLLRSIQSQSNSQSVKGTSSITGEVVILTNGEGKIKKNLEEYNNEINKESKKSLDASVMDNKKTVKNISNNKPTSFINLSPNSQVNVVSDEYLSKYQSAIDSSKPSQRIKLDHGKEKITPRFINMEYPAKLLLIQEDDPTQIYDASALFILQQANEGISLRNEIVSTHGSDVLNLFGKNVRVWSYSGTTFNGGKSPDVTAGDKRKDTSSNDGTKTSVFWYDDINGFLSDYLGQPQIDNKKYRVRMEYEGFVREGYVLDFSFQHSSNNYKIVGFNFRMAIKDFYNSKVVNSEKVT